MSTDDVNTYISYEEQNWGTTDRGTYAHVRYEERRRCAARGHGTISPGVLVQTNGIKQVCNHCTTCGDRIGGAIPAAGHDKNSLPVFKDNTAIDCRFGHTTTYGRVIARDGRQRIVEGCSTCGAILGTADPDNMPAPPDTWPVISDGRYDYDGYAITPPCDHCGAHEGTQRHHWAPKAMFTDPDNWPTSNLCVPCHQHWHRTVTPSLVRSGR